MQHSKPGTQGCRVSPLRKRQEGPAPGGAGCLQWLPETSALLLSPTVLGRQCQCLDWSCTDLYQSLWDPQAPDAGEAKWVPDSKVSFMQNGEVKGRKGNCPRLELKWVGNETHLVLLRYNRLWSIHLSQLGELRATPNPAFPDSGCLDMWP